MLAAQHTIYSMNAGLKVTYLYHDGDIVEVRIVAENVSFRASADVYVGTDGLLEAAAVLEDVFSAIPFCKAEIENFFAVPMADAAGARAEAVDEPR